jgi:hypothetical protein
MARRYARGISASDGFFSTLACIFPTNMKFLDRRQKCSHNDMLINVAAQHFFKTAPRRPGMAAILSIFTPISAD